MRKIEKYELKKRTFYMGGPKGIQLSCGMGGTWRSIDFDNWLKSKKREGFTVIETPEGTKLERESIGNMGTMKEKIFIGKKDITFTKKPLKKNYEEEYDKLKKNYEQLEEVT